MRVRLGGKPRGLDRPLRRSVAAARGRPLRGGIAAALAATLSATTPAAAAPRPTTIDPLDGPVAAAPLLLDMHATLQLTGRAAPGAPIDLAAACSLRLCTTSATANRRGRWKAKLHVVVPPTRTTIFVRASTGASRRVTLTPPEPVTGSPELALIGDSLAVGTAPYLPELLPGWRVTADALGSRFLLTGMEILATARIRPRRPIAVAFSLFTNDDPRRADELAYWARESVTRLPRGSCALWATIVRPRVAGVSYARANALLEQVAREPRADGKRIVVVPWARAVRLHPEWLRRDRVHATDEGYRARAQLYADAALRCGL